MLGVKVDGHAAGQAICQVVGELDLYGAPYFRQVLADLPSGTRVLIDLSDVSFVDSAGLGALIGGIRRTRDRGGDAAVACDRPSLSRLLRTIGLDRLVTISSDTKQAMAALYGTGVSLPEAV
jgi:anti-sigma B factor antagonist